MGLPQKIWDNESNIFPLYIQSTLMAWLCFQGANFEDIISGTELETGDFADPDKKINFNTLSRLVENSSQYWGKPGLGLAFGKNLSLFLAAASLGRLPLQPLRPVVHASIF